VRSRSFIVLTPTSVAGVAVGGSAANAEKKLRQLLGAPTTQELVARPHPHDAGHLLLGHAAKETSREAYDEVIRATSPSWER